MAIPAFFKIAAEAKKYKGVAEGDISSIASVAGAGKFNPDKRIEPGIDRLDINKAKFDPDKRIDHDTDRKIEDYSTVSERPSDEVSDSEFYTRLDDRVDFAARHGDGIWSGEHGRSEFTPKDQKAIEALEKKGVKSIEYDENGEPGFHPVSEGTVKIENMTADRYSYIDENGIKHIGNFEKADIKLAEQWNAECKEGRTDYTSKDVKSWVKENNLTRHECLDRETVEYVDSDIHRECKHYGGVAECKARDIINAGGKFDV